MNNYPSILKVAHFLSAGLVFTLLIQGIYMLGIADVDRLISYYDAHKSLGALQLGLVVLATAWRMRKGAPAKIRSHARWGKVLARSAHGFLLILLVAMPVSGWLMSNAAGFAVPFFGLFDLPNLVDQNERLMTSTQLLHRYLAWTLLAVVTLHIAGALKHHFLDRDETLKRMTSARLGISGGTIVALMAMAVLATPVLMWTANSDSPAATHDSAHSSAHEAAHGAAQQAASGMDGDPGVEQHDN
jgi:cytochrome b561